jgi:hypothetical protein
VSLLSLKMAKAMIDGREKLVPYGQQ